VGRCVVRFVPAVDSRVGVPYRDSKFIMCLHIQLFPLESLPILSGGDTHSIMNKDERRFGWFGKNIGGMKQM